MKNIFISLLIFIPVFLILAVTVKGLPGNPDAEQVNSRQWKEDGPFELSPERGRFALTYSLAEDRSIHFSIPVARFVAPDVAFSKGNYVSLFPPGLSYLVIPGYLIGKYLGISQVGTFAIISIFAVLNLLLIRAIVKYLSKNELAGLVSGLIFVFATPAFAYAGSLYQHHVTTFLVLTSIYLLLRSSSIVTLSVVLFLCAFSIPLDSPNAIFLFPIGLYSILKLINIETLASKINIQVRYFGLISLIVALVPLSLLFIYNFNSHGEPFKLSGTLATVRIINEQGQPVLNALTGELQSIEALEQRSRTKSASSFFKTRNLLNGVYTHLVSPDRGILFFTPVVLFGFIGIAAFPKLRNDIRVLMLSVLGVIFLLYSLWGDPWGGWAFGDRYMIPAYALLCVFIGIGLSTITKRFFLTLLFTGAIVYSLSVNTLGALTTHANPPAVEAVGLEKITGRVEKYSYDRNWDYLNLQGSKSYFYRTYLSDSLTPRNFYFVLVIGNTIFILSLLISYIWSTRKI